MSTENTISKEKAQEMLRNYDRKEILARKRELQRDVIELTRQFRRRGLMIVRHNTILGLRDGNGKVSHIIDTSKRGLKNLHDVDRHLTVPRYEPSVAKKWLQEPLVLNGGHDEFTSKMEKVLLSESELREVVLADKTQHLDHINDTLRIEAVLRGVMNAKTPQEGDKIVADARKRNAEARKQNRETRGKGNATTL